MRPGEIRSTISGELPKERRRLAEALRHVYACIPARDGRPVSQAELLKCMKVGHVGKSSLCRYLQGENVPDERFIDDFYAVAHSLATGTLPLTCEELQVMRKEAKETDGRRRAVGQKAHTAADGTPRPLVALPVPHGTGDRQGNEFAGLPAPQAAIEAIQLTEQGREAQAVTLLSRLSEHLDSDEVALCVVHFRRQHYDDLAITLIRIYGRDHYEDHQQKQIIRLSMTLREHELHMDADALLKVLIDGKDVDSYAGRRTAG